MRLLNPDNVTLKQEKSWDIHAKRFILKPGFQYIGLKSSITLYNTDYTLRVTDICNIMSASRAWIEKYFTPYVKHIYLPVYCDAQLYYSVTDFWKYYGENAKAYYQKNDNIPVSPLKRSIIPFTEIELPKTNNPTSPYNVGYPINYYSNLYKCSRETMLRHMFKDNAIKIIIFGKVYWVNEKL